MSEPTRHRNSDSEEIVLLAVTGMSPAVITETIWALAAEQPPIIPHQVIALTTTEGRRRLIADLLEPADALAGKCVWDALRYSLGSAGHDLAGRLRFGDTAADIRVLAACDPLTGRSRDMDDIRTLEDNSAAADHLLDEVRRIVENPDTKLIASLAGGRKTMGALVYACMTLLGRETDRLTHVLVSEPFEDPRLQPRFFFPSQPTGPLTAPGGSMLEPASAQIQLADVPFVPLRNLFERELARKPGRFMALVEQCRKRVGELSACDVQIRLNRHEPQIAVNGTHVKLSPAQYILIRFLAEQAAAERPAFAKYGAAIDSLREFAESLYALRKTDAWGDWHHYCRLADGFDDQQLRKLLDQLRAKLKRGGSETAKLLPFLPGKGNFSLRLPPNLIFFED